jgi:hypothetical protein
MMPPMREIIAAHPLSTQYEVDGDRVLHAFINFMLVPPKPKKSRSRWERYDRKSHKKKKPYATWFLIQLLKYLHDNRGTLANLPLNPFKPGTGRPIPQLPPIELIVVYQRPSRDCLPTSCITLDDDVAEELTDQSLTLRGISTDMGFSSKFYRAARLDPRKDDQGFSTWRDIAMQNEINEPPEDPRAPPEDQAMVDALTEALNRMIADHVSGQPAHIATPTLIDVLAVYLGNALDKCATPAERKQMLQRIAKILQPKEPWF